MARMRELLDKSADVERIIGLFERLIKVATSASEQIPKIPKSERWQKLEHPLEFVGAVMLGNFAAYPEINKAYLELKHNGPRKLADGSTHTENDFMMGLQAYCGLSDLIIANGGDRAAVYAQCADRLDLLEMNLETEIADPLDPSKKIKLLDQEQLYEMMGAFQKDLVSDAVRRVKKWVEKTIVDQLKELDAAMQEWAERPSAMRLYVEKCRGELKQRKTWNFWKRLKWASGFRKNL